VHGGSPSCRDPYLLGGGVTLKVLAFIHSDAPSAKMSIFILPLGGAESAYFIFCIVLPDNEVGPYLLFSRNQKPKRGACMVWVPASYRVRVPPALSALCPG